MRLTSDDLLGLGVADDVIEEPAGGAHSDWETASGNVFAALKRHLAELTALGTDELLARRWAKYEEIGDWAGKAAERRSGLKGPRLDEESGRSVRAGG